MRTLAGACCPPLHQVREVTLEWYHMTSGVREIPPVEERRTILQAQKDSLQQAEVELSQRLQEKETHEAEAREAKRKSLLPREDAAK
eukprot:15439439-Alexandrium_andersonii.AAC.1